MSSAVQHISTLSTPSQVSSLSPAQVQVAASLAQGRSVTATAAEAGVHRTTVHHWQRTVPEFRTAVEESRREYVLRLQDDLRELSATALETLKSLLNSPDTPASVRLRAALAVLERPQFPEQDWRLPERVESAREQHIVDELAALEAGYRSMRHHEALLRAGCDSE